MGTQWLDSGLDAIAVQSGITVFVQEYDKSRRRPQVIFALNVLQHHRQQSHKNGCLDGARDHVHLFYDGVLDMAHMHSFLQEEKEDGSIEETFANFYNYEEDELRDCLTKKHWEYATILIGLDSELSCRSISRLLQNSSNVRVTLSLHRVLSPPFYLHLETGFYKTVSKKSAAKQVLINRFQTI